MMKKLVSGDEALALGLYEAGVTFASAYPGTPSTEILENAAKYEEIDAEWAPNERQLWKRLSELLFPVYGPLQL